jgi:peptidoglycan-associated lipoprotein
MRVSLLGVLVFPLVVGCSTMHPAHTPDLGSASVSESSGPNLAGKWTGNWMGTGLFPTALREDAVSLDLVQQGNVGHGRLVVEGTTAAEAVPWEIRRAGQWGTRVIAQISADKVTLRHHVDGRVFTADLRVNDAGDRMIGHVRDSWPRVGMVLTREQPKTPPAPQQSAKAAPAPEPAPAPTVGEPARIEPAPQVVAMIPEPKPEEQPQPKEPENTARPKQSEFLAVQELPAIHFDYDKSELRADAVDTLQGHIAWLKEHADSEVQIAGHCDERGTSEYNLALGDRRAKSVRDHFSAYGIAPERVSTVSHGKERPACGADTPQCHEINRRAEFKVRAR